MYTALHAPTDEYQSGFISENAAYSYIEEQSSYCKCGEKPCEARMCEWFVMKTEDYFKADDFSDILKASGFKKVKNR